MKQVLQRPYWSGTPVDLGDVFVLHKDGREATCRLRTHLLGWELTLVGGTDDELLRSQVCRTEEDVLATAEAWKAAMIERGWQ